MALTNGNAQNCNLSIEGNVFDEVSNLPLAFVNVIVQETSVGTMTDIEGNFIIENVCEGEYHMIFSHIGCEAIKMHFEFDQDTFLNISLSHSSTSLDAVVIEGKKENFDNQPSLSVNRETIEDNSNETLSNILENETGVSLIKNGSGITKPVVQGLYGSRLTVLNNGIVQSGQQWGNDHSPEIDPFANDLITVLKGASAIEFGGGNLGSVILVEPKKIEREPHLHGQVNYVYETNGRGHTLNTRIAKYSEKLAWRVNGTLKKYGDRKSADYFLNNTGSTEANLSLQLEKSINDKIFFDFVASTFNTSIGILRGSQIGNLTDLESALEREIPFFTEPDFSYDIDAPKQKVAHHLIKLKTRYYLKEDQKIELILAGQNNDRKEFDVRRNNSDVPSLNIEQYTFNSEIKYTNEFGDNWNLKLGNQNIITDNTNNPETGILPLIPDYISWKSGVFGLLAKSKNKTQYNLGFRYDYEYQNVATISQTFPREVVRYKNNFNNLSGLLAIKYSMSKAHTMSLNTGYAMRNPAVNELYASGLHQGVSGIEEGDANLKTEKALKAALDYKWLPSTNFSLNTLVYYQYFNDYIFLDPQEEIRLTIRGAFPVFTYEQTNANIYGLDISTEFTINSSVFGSLKYSYIKGEDRLNNEPLVFMPSNTLFGSLVYRSKQALKLSNNVIIEDSEIELSNRFVFNQNNILATQDFVAPPPSYNLLGVKFSSNIFFSSYKIRFFAKVDNLFNVSYRDYLNRQRYFADDLGVSFVTGLSFKF